MQEMPEEKAVTKPQAGVPPRVWCAIADLSEGESEWFMQMPPGALSWEKTNEHDVPFISLAEHTAIVAELERKLERAVNALDKIADACPQGRISIIPQKALQACAGWAREALAEIRGEGVETP